MGINGLLQQLKSISRSTHVSAYRGHKVAIDGYSWLHKGAYSCSRELCEGIWTDGYVRYFLSRIDMLVSNGVTPVVVFDGCPLPLKADEEGTRSRSRREALERARSHTDSGNLSAAMECYQRAVDIAPWMAKVVMEALRERNITCMVAPYEADAQMSYLALRGDVHAVLTEDSDMLAYGCPRVLYKLDRSGTGEEVVLADMPLVRELNMTGFDHDMLLQMCILAGCDFLPNVAGVGIKKAHAMMRRHRDFVKVIRYMRFNGNAPPPGYEVRFQRTIWLFRHQRVFCPTSRTLAHLRPLPQGGIGAADVLVVAALPPEGPERMALDFLGPPMEQAIAAGIAQGDLDPSSLNPFDLPTIYRGCTHPPTHLRALLQLPPPRPHPHSQPHHRSNPSQSLPDGPGSSSQGGPADHHHERRHSWGGPAYGPISHGRAGGLSRPPLPGASSQGPHHGARREGGRPPVPRDPKQVITRFFQVQEPAASQPFRHMGQQPADVVACGGGRAGTSGCGAAKVVTLSGVRVETVERAEVEAGGAGGGSGCGDEATGTLEVGGNTPPSAKRRKLNAEQSAATTSCAAESKDGAGGHAVGSLFAAHKRKHIGVLGAGERSTCDARLSQSAAAGGAAEWVPSEGGDGSQAATAPPPSLALPGCSGLRLASAGASQATTGGTCSLGGGGEAHAAESAGEEPLASSTGPTREWMLCAAGSDSQFDSQLTSGCEGSGWLRHGPGGGGGVLAGQRSRAPAHLAMEALFSQPSGSGQPSQEPPCCISTGAAPSSGPAPGPGRFRPVSALAALQTWRQAGGAPGCSQPLASVSMSAPSPSKLSHPDVPSLSIGRNALQGHDQTATSPPLLGQQRPLNGASTTTGAPRPRTGRTPPQFSIYDLDDMDPGLDAALGLGDGAAGRGERMDIEHILAGSPKMDLGRGRHAGTATQERPATAGGLGDDGMTLQEDLFKTGLYGAAESAGTPQRRRRGACMGIGGGVIREHVVGLQALAQDGGGGSGGGMDEDSDDGEAEVTSPFKGRGPGSLRAPRLGCRISPVLAAGLSTRQRRGSGGGEARGEQEAKETSSSPPSLCPLAPQDLNQRQHRPRMGLLHPSARRRLSMPPPPAVSVAPPPPPRALDDAALLGLLSTAGLAADPGTEEEKVIRTAFGTRRRIQLGGLEGMEEVEEVLLGLGPLGRVAQVQSPAQSPTLPKSPLLRAFEGGCVGGGDVTAVGITGRRRQLLQARAAAVTSREDDAVQRPRNALPLSLPPSTVKGSSRTPPRGELCEYGGVGVVVRRRSWIEVDVEMAARVSDGRQEACEQVEGGMCRSAAAEEGEEEKHGRGSDGDDGDEGDGGDGMDMEAQRLMQALDRSDKRRRQRLHMEQQQLQQQEQDSGECGLAVAAATAAATAIRREARALELHTHDGDGGGDGGDEGSERVEEACGRLRMSCGAGYAPHDAGELLGPSAGRGAAGGDRGHESGCSAGAVSVCELLGGSVQERFERAMGGDELEGAGCRAGPVAARHEQEGAARRQMLEGQQQQQQQQDNEQQRQEQEQGQQRQESRPQEQDDQGASCLPPAGVVYGKAHNEDAGDDDEDSDDVLITAEVTNPGAAAAAASGGGGFHSVSHVERFAQVAKAAVDRITNHLQQPSQPPRTAVMRSHPASQQPARGAAAFRPPAHLAWQPPRRTATQKQPAERAGGLMKIPGGGPVMEAAAGTGPGANPRPLTDFAFTRSAWKRRPSNTGVARSIPVGGLGGLGSRRPSVFVQSGFEEEEGAQEVRGTTHEETRRTPPPQVGGGEGVGMGAAADVAQVPPRQPGSAPDLAAVEGDEESDEVEIVEVGTTAVGLRVGSAAQTGGLTQAGRGGGGGRQALSEVMLRRPFQAPRGAGKKSGGPMGIGGGGKGKEHQQPRITELARFALKGSGAK